MTLLWRACTYRTSPLDPPSACHRSPSFLPLPPPNYPLNTPSLLPFQPPHSLHQRHHPFFFLPLPRFPLFRPPQRPNHQHRTSSPSSSSQLNRHQPPPPSCRCCKHTHTHNPPPSIGDPHHHRPQSPISASLPAFLCTFAPLPPRPSSDQTQPHHHRPSRHRRTLPLSLSPNHQPSNRHHRPLLRLQLTATKSKPLSADRRHQPPQSPLPSPNSTPNTPNRTSPSRTKAGKTKRGKKNRRERVAVAAPSLASTPRSLPALQSALLISFSLSPPRPRRRYSIACRRCSVVRLHCRCLPSPIPAPACVPLSRLQEKKEGDRRKREREGRAGPNFL